MINYERNYDKSRSFNSDWCKIFPWFHYDINLDASFYFVYMDGSRDERFTNKSPSQNETFVT